MSEFLKRTWAEINLDAIRNNYNEIRKAVKPSAKIMAVVKADAYGHGAEYIAKELSADGADWFALSNLEEAMQLRRAGIDEPLLILGYTPPEYATELAVNGISQAVFSADYGKRLSECARKKGVQVNIHIKIDTGMSRIGFLYHDTETDKKSVDEIAKVCSLPGLYPEGIFTHFASADEGRDGEVFTRLQFDLFLDVISRLKALGTEFELRHCCNSAGIMDYPEMHLDMVRPGIILYGLDPSPVLKGRLDLKPAMELKTVISLIKTIEAETPVSYGRTFVTDKETTIATVPVGYADGYPRALSNRVSMIVNGKRVPAIGRVCMDQMMLDITDVPGVKEGDTVTVFGSDGNEEITVDELADMLGTINYEIICGISKRVPRIYKNDGEYVCQLDYIG